MKFTTVAVWTVLWGVAAGGSIVGSVAAQEPDLLCYYTTASGRLVDLQSMCSRFPAIKAIPAATPASPATPRATPQTARSTPPRSTSATNSLNGIWLSKVTSGGQFMMGMQLKITENKGRLKVDFVGAGKAYKTVTGKRTGNRIEIQDGDRLVGTLSADGNRIQFPARNKTVITMYRLGSPSCLDTGDFRRNFQSCN